MPNPNDPLIVQRLEANAKANAGPDTTGYAWEGNIGCRYYPGCETYRWLNESGPITKRLAVKLLCGDLAWAS